MWIVSRYVLRELLKVFLLTLAGMTVLMLIVGVAHEAIRQGLGPEPILKLVPYATPNALRFAVPGTMLFAACSVFGRMAAGNEIVALKSLGISPMKVISPALALAFLVSLVAVWMNDLAVSWGRRGMERVVLHSVEQIIYGMLRSQSSYRTKQFSVSVKDVEDRRLIRPMICFHTQDGKPPVVLTAQEAELQLNPAQGTLTIRMTNGEVTMGDQASMVFPNTISREIPLTDAAKKAGVSASPSNLPMWLLAPETERQRESLEQLRLRCALDASYALLTGDLESLSGAEWDPRHRELRASTERLHRLKTEPWRRWANGFSCLFFVVVGAPLAMHLRNSDLWTSFAIVFLPILIVYYPLLLLGVDQAKSGNLPPCAVWAGNLLLGLAGIWLLRRIVRY
jgi:lipopolysaccharide export system permease protein